MNFHRILIGCSKTNKTFHGKSMVSWTAIDNKILPSAAHRANSDNFLIKVMLLAKDFLFSCLFSALKLFLR